MDTKQYFTRGAALLAALMSLACATAFAADGQKSEQELIAVLRSGAPADKALACKALATVGSKAAVPELAKLLPDEQLSSWARIALEAIPDQAADEALRSAAR
jgi:HEAT repeat protein